MARVIAAGKVHKVTKKKDDRGTGKKGDIVVEQNSPTGKKQRMNLTKLAGSRTVKQGVKATKKFHREHPEVK